MKQKYQKVKGHWNYCFIFSDGMFYIGESGKKHCCDRWKPTKYKTTVVEPYIERDGWENIRKVVLCDGLTKEQALQLEDLLIQEATKGGWCINKQRSGGVWVNNRREYQNKAQSIFNKKRLSTPEGKIYNRVHRYNEYYPDKVIETALEAKNKYLEYGYIPSYIKNDDLI